MFSIRRFGFARFTALQDTYGKVQRPVKTPRKKWRLFAKVLIGVPIAFLVSLLASGPLLISEDIAQPSDAIVVIGGDHKPERVRRAVELYQMGYAPRVIISAGTTVLEGNDELPEAELLRRQALSIGLPETAIIVEAQSKSTFENAYYSRQICHQYGIRSILLVTSALHSKRAKTIFQDVMEPEIRVSVQPAIPESCQACWLFDPSEIYVVFYEYQNWIRYWLDAAVWAGNNAADSSSTFRSPGMTGSNWLLPPDDSGSGIVYNESRYLITR